SGPAGQPRARADGFRAATSAPGASAARLRTARRAAPASAGRELDGGAGLAALVEQRHDVGVADEEPAAERTPRPPRVEELETSAAGLVRAVAEAEVAVAAGPLRVGGRHEAAGVGVEHA